VGGKGGILKTKKGRTKHNETPEKKKRSIHPVGGKGLRKLMNKHLRGGGFQEKLT